MGYWLYYLACIVLALAVDRPWVALLGLAFIVLRPVIADPVVFLDTVADMLDLREQLNANPTDIKARRDLAVLWLRRERPRRALALLLEADRRDPGNADTLYLLGLARLRAGDAAGALDPLVRAADIDPWVRFGEPYLVAGEALMHLERFEEAEDALEHYTRASSSSVRGFSLLAAVRAARDDMPAARDALSHARDTYREVPAFKRKGQLGAWLFALSGAPLLARWPLARRVTGPAAGPVLRDLAAFAALAAAALLFSAPPTASAPAAMPWQRPEKAAAWTDLGEQDDDSPSHERRHLMPSEQSTEQGVALVRQVIEKVKASDLGLLDSYLPKDKRRPRPLSRGVIASLRLPGNRPLSPSLAEWLAFDAGFFEWLDDEGHPVLPERNVGELALAVYSEDDAQMAAAFTGLTAELMKGFCLPVPVGTESRRFVYLSEPDELGEYPVLMLDIDDQPYVGVEYPGIDVYLATHAGLIEAPERNTAGSYADDPRFRSRMEHHIRTALGGHAYLEPGDEGFPISDGTLDNLASTVIGEGVEVPEGYEVSRVGMNPFTKKPMYFLKRKDRAY